MRRAILAGLVVATLATVPVALAKAPATGKTPSNLAAAQKAIAQALGKMTAAQKANEYDISGHAAKARELLEQANAELRLATEKTGSTK